MKTNKNAIAKSDYTQNEVLNDFLKWPILPFYNERNDYNFERNIISRCNPDRKSE